jgi:hypothetical protein
MPRHTSRNKSFYHYVIHFYNSEGELMADEYFLTLFHIMERFNVCRKTLMSQIKNPERRSHKLKNIKIYRVHIPVQDDLFEPQDELAVITDNE